MVRFSCRHIVKTFFCDHGAKRKKAMSAVNKYYIVDIKFTQFQIMDFHHHLAPLEASLNNSFNLSFKCRLWVRQKLMWWCHHVSGVNIGGAGSYVYNTPANEAPASVSMETDAKPAEEKRPPVRGPVKGKNQ